MMVDSIFGREYRTTIFGKPYAGSGKDVRTLAEDLAGDLSPDALPKFYLCCGSEYSLLDANRKYASYLKGLGYAVTFEEGPGNHEWDFWNRYIRRILDILPLDENAQGINSGNIGPS